MAERDGPIGDFRVELSAIHMGNYTRLVAGVVLSTLVFTLLLIFAASEDVAAKLLRHLRVGRRLSPDECLLLRPPLPSEAPKKEAHLKTQSTRPKGPKLLLRMLFLDGRISPNEYSVLWSAHEYGVPSGWRRIVRDRITTRIQSWRNPFRTSAVARVFRTPELVEHILIYVTHQDLALNIPRTCRRFHDMITTSPALRHRLFLEPDPKCSPQIVLPITMWDKTFSFHINGGHYSAGFRSERYYGDRNFDRLLVKRLRSYAGLQQVMLAQPPVHAVSMVIESFRETFKISSSHEKGVTVGDILAKLNEAFDMFAEATEVPDTRNLSVRLKMPED